MQQTANPRATQARPGTEKPQSGPNLERRVQLCSLSTPSDFHVLIDGEVRGTYHAIAMAVSYAAGTEPKAGMGATWFMLAMPSLADAWFSSRDVFMDKDAALREAVRRKGQN